MKILLIAAVLLWPSLAGAREYHFVNANLITMGDDAISPGELLVRGDQIVAAGPGVAPGADAVRIDVAGGYLIPGLAEMHAHVPGTREESRYRNEVLFLYVANGITTARGMLGSPEHLQLRAALEAQEILGPRLYTSGPSFNGNSVSSPEQARQMAQSQFEAGYDFLKVHPGLTLAEYQSMASTANELGIPFAGHVPADVGLLRALEAGQATIDHLDGYVQALVPNLTVAEGGLFAPELLGQTDDGRIALVVEATRKAGAWIVPTETLLENFAAAGNLDTLLARPQNRYLPRPLLARYTDALSRRGSNVTAAAAQRYLALRKRLVREMHAAGTGILLGSDAPQIFNVPGFSAHRELLATVAAGLTPFDALRTATVNPASYFGAEDEFGLLVEGMAADIVWLRANPLANINNSKTIHGVMVRGRWLDRQALDRGLARIAARHAD